MQVQGAIESFKILRYSFFHVMTRGCQVSYPVHRQVMLTLKAPKMKVVESANSVDSDELPQLNLPRSQGYKKISCSTQLSMKFLLLIFVKVQTMV